MEQLLVRDEDAVEMLAFAEMCYRKLVVKRPMGTDRCGFFRVGEGANIIPFVKTKAEGKKVVPEFYFEDDPSKASLAGETVTGWDAAHLKLCLKVHV